MKKVASVVVCSFMFLLGLVGCSSTTLPDGLQEKELISQANQALDFFNAQSFSELTKMFEQSLQVNLTQENWQAASEQLAATVGEFEEVTSTSCAGQKGNDGKEYAIVALICKYEKSALNCIVSFDSQGSLIGFVFQ